MFWRERSFDTNTTSSGSENNVNFSNGKYVSFSFVSLRIVFLGISSLSSCADVDQLPALPPGEEQRLQRAAQHLQQKLILREWLKDNNLENHYTR